MDLVVLVHEQPVAAGEVELDRCQVGGPQVIVVGALEAHEYTWFVFAQLERSRAVGSPHPFPSSLNVVLIHHKGGGIGEFGKQVWLGCIDVHADGGVVNNADPGNRIRLAFELLRGTNDVSQEHVRSRSLCCGISSPFDGPLEILRRHCPAIVELCVGIEVEYIPHPVRVHCPFLCQVRDNLQVGIDGKQPPKHLENVPRRGYVPCLVRIREWGDRCRATTARRLARGHLPARCQ